MTTHLVKSIGRTKPQKRRATANAGWGFKAAKLAKEMK